MACLPVPSRQGTALVQTLCWWQISKSSLFCLFRFINQVKNCFPNSFIILLIRLNDPNLIRWRGQYGGNLIFPIWNPWLQQFQIMFWRFDKIGDKHYIDVLVFNHCKDHTCICWFTLKKCDVLKVIFHEIL